MKKRLGKLFGLLAISLVLALPQLGIYGAAAEATGSWTVTNGSASGSVLTAEGTENDLSAVYSEKLNLNDGISISYDIKEFTLNEEVQGNAAEMDKQILKFSFLSKENYGISLVVRPYRLQWGAKLNQRMMVAVYYTNNGVEMEDPMWYFDTYLEVFDDTHTISIQHSYGSFYVEGDNRVAPPYRPACNWDLSETTMTVSMHSCLKAASVDIKSIAAEKKNITEGEWLDMGPSEHIYQPDGSITYKNIDEPFTADVGSGNVWLHARLGSVRGYDVTEKITLKVHYNLNGAGVWWGMYFANQAMLPLDQEKTSIDYSDNCTICKGIQFQNVTPFKAQSYYYKQEGDTPTEEEAKELKQYYPNGVSVAYAGEEMLNTIEIEIGETATKISFNGTLLWDDYKLTRDDFSAENGGDGKVYFIFEFIETPATATRGIDMTIKGINVPEITSSTSVTRAKADTSDVVLNVTDPGNGALRLYDANRNQMDSSLYSYADGKFTVKAAAFADLAVNEDTPYNFFVGNDGGLDGFSVRIMNEVVALQPAVITPGSYTLEKAGSATEDLVLSVDFKTGSFVSLVGGGLTRSQYTVQEPTGDSTVGTITLSKDFLNNLKDGTVTLKMTTEDLTGAQEVTEFKITVGNSSSGGEKNPSRGGCSSVLFASAGGAAVAALAAGAWMLRRKK